MENETENKKSKPWLFPLIAIVVIIVGVLFLAGGENVAPFLYEIF